LTQSQGKEVAKVQIKGPFHEVGYKRMIVHISAPSKNQQEVMAIYANNLISLVELRSEIRHVTKREDR
jgi:hypothetical protein